MAPSPKASGWVVVALGSNLGNSPALLRSGMDRLEQVSGQPIRRSSLWSSSPVDCPPGSPQFTNAVVVFPFPSGFSPETWLTATQQLERELGRTPKTVHNEARCIDLDLIVWGDEIRNTGRLTLPHPRAHLRRFVLQPMAELVPDFVLPGQARTVVQLLEACAEDPQFRRLADDPTVPRQ